MSLFSLAEWFSTDIEQAGCLAVGTVIRNQVFDQVVIGGEDGIISILDPSAERPEDALLLQKNTGKTALEIFIGEFLTGQQSVIAILSTKALTFYSFNYDSTDLSQTNLNEIFSHTLTETAYNMCQVPTPNQPVNQILVQSVGCGLTLFLGDQCIFSRAPLPALLPGPIGYNIPSSSVLIASGARIHSAKFSLISTISNTGKKVTFDWVYSLGDAALQMAMDDGPPVQPSIVILCRRNVFCFTPSGNLRWHIRLECVATSFILYQNGDSQMSHMCIASSNNMLLVYADTSLLWTCKTTFVPVTVAVGAYGALHRGLVTILSATGTVLIGFLGTEPNLYTVAVDSRYVDLKAKRDEIIKMEEVIKQHQGTGPIIEKQSFDFRLLETEIVSTTKSKKEGATISVVLQVDGAPPDEKIEFHAYTCMQYDLTSVKDSKYTFMFTVVADSDKASDNSVQFVAISTHSQLICCKTIDLPLLALFQEASPDRNGKYKMTIDTDRPVLPLSQLFSELQTENPSSIAFQEACGEGIISIFAANKTNRYRIQTDNPSAMYVIVKELIRRLKSQEKGINIYANLPMEIVEPLVEEHVKLESNLSTLTKEQRNRAREVREIQMLIMNKLKNTKADNIKPLDLLLDKSYNQLMDSTNRLRQLYSSLSISSNNISSMFHIIHLILQLSNTTAVLSGFFYSNTNQLLLDRLRWAAGTVGDPSQLLSVLCRNTNNNVNLSQITEAEEEET